MNVGLLPLKAKEEFLAITVRPDNLERSVIKTSVTPSAKYSCSGSLLKLVKGRTAMEGLSAVILEKVSLMAMGLG